MNAVRVPSAFPYTTLSADASAGTCLLPARLNPATGRACAGRSGRADSTRPLTRVLTGGGGEAAGTAARGLRPPCSTAARPDRRSLPARRPAEEAAGSSRPSASLPIVTDAGTRCARPAALPHTRCAGTGRLPPGPVNTTAATTEPASDTDTTSAVTRRARLPAIRHRATTRRTRPLPMSHHRQTGPGEKAGRSRAFPSA